MVTHEQTGLVVPMNDPGALARGVLRLLREPETAARLGAAAHQRYWQSYRPESMTRALEALFVELIERDHADVRSGSRSSPKPAVMRQQS
jgi:rhamnosyl/mannosyltransferase